MKYFDLTNEPQKGFNWNALVVPGALLVDPIIMNELDFAAASDMGDYLLAVYGYEEYLDTVSRGFIKP